MFHWAVAKDRTNESDVFRGEPPTSCLWDLFPAIVIGVNCHTLVILVLTTQGIWLQAGLILAIAVTAHDGYEDDGGLHTVFDRWQHQ